MNYYQIGEQTMSIFKNCLLYTSNDNNSVRIWAGTTEENRANAPFLVRQDGRMVANNASIR